MVILDLILLLISIFFLVKSSDYLVSSASNIARRFGIKQIVIGLTIVAFGTSIPELASSIAAVFAKDSEIILGNVAGSNIANIGLILAIGSLITIITVNNKIIKRDVYFLVFITIIFYIFSLNGNISRIEGFILILFLIFYAYNLFKKKKHPILEEAEKYARIEEKKTITQKVKNIRNVLKHILTKDFYIVLFSIIVLAVSAHFSVVFLQNLAFKTKIGEGIIAATLLSVGTSLPELIVTITSARKKLNDILVGNLIGSNIANILIVAGIPALIMPLQVSGKFITFIIPSMIVFTLLMLVVFKLLNTIRYTGIVFLLLYVLFLILLFI